MRIVKAHAFGNDFLLTEESQMTTGADRPALARELCDRHCGIGADGLIVYASNRMQLLNADGSYSEVSGNGVRCLAAWLATQGNLAVGAHVAIETDAGVKDLELLERNGRRLTFRAAMGHPEDVRQRALDVDGTPITAVTLRVGNPQCVVLGDVTEDRLRSVGARLAVHAAFPHGTNVELATVERPDRVRILIWERGAGPTHASGTGACAAAVAAAAYGGAGRDVDVVSPGGTQRVEWTDQGLFLTGWAEVIFEGRRL
ncbi:MAG TPA: diaminopimelate epimerase [Vicinamibacterales bacterium]|nr:diaminopimelate epimerase [Vicinamibacterales bacterium]